MPDSPKKRGLSPEQKAECRERFEGGWSIKKLSETYGVKRDTIAAWRDNPADPWAVTGQRTGQVSAAKNKAATSNGQQVAGIASHSDASGTEVGDVPGNMPAGEPDANGQMPDDTAGMTDDEFDTSARRHPTAPKNTNYHAARDLYVTSNDTYASIGRQVGVSESAIAAVASDRAHPVNDGRTWPELRAEFRAAVSDELLEQEKQTQVTRALTVNAAQREAIGQLVDKAIPKALEALDGVGIEDRDKVKIALAALAMQRKIHGLDRATTLRNEPAKPGGSEDDVRLEDGVSAEDAALAERALHDLFGDRPDVGEPDVAAAGADS